MPSFVIHIAVANEYFKKHNMKEEKEEFIKGTIKPDFTDNKLITHYEERLGNVNLKEFLETNEIKSSFDRGYFLHLVTDYLFYNHYLDKYLKHDMYNDYYILNKDIVEKYNVLPREEIKKYMTYKEGKTKVLSLELICKVIDEVSSLDLDEVAREVKNNNEKWKYFKNLI